MNDSKKSKKTQKYVSVRRALKELKINEEELKEKVADGDIRSYRAENQLKFDPDDLQKYMEEKDKKTPKKPGMASRAASIEDEKLYETQDGTFDSLFLSRSVIARAEELASQETKDKKDKKEKKPIKESPTSKASAEPAPEKPPEISKNKREVAKSSPATKRILPPSKKIVAEEQLASPSPEKSRSSSSEPREEFYPSSEVSSIGLGNELKKMAFSIVALILLGNILIWMFVSKRMETPPPEILPISASEVVRGEFTFPLSSPGEVIPQKGEKQVSLVEGKVASLHFQVGDRVAKGDKLVEIENSNFQHQLWENENQLDLAQKELEQARASWQLSKAKVKLAPTSVEREISSLVAELEQSASENTITEQQLDLAARIVQAEEKWRKLALLEKVSKAAFPYWSEIVVEYLHYRTSYKKLQFHLNRAQRLKKRQQELYTITAPYEGIIVRSWIDNASYVHPGSELLLLANNDQLQIKCLVKESNFSQIDLSKPVTITRAGQSTSQVLTTAKIIEVSSQSQYSADFALQGYQVLLQPEKQQKLFYEQQIQAIFSSKEDTQLLVSSKALQAPPQQENNNRTTVLRIYPYQDNYKAEVVALEIAQNNGKQAAVVEGLEEGDLVIVGPATVFSKIDTRTIVKLDRVVNR